MSIINLTDAYKNFEEIQLSANKSFKIKSDYTTDAFSLFSETLNDSSGIIINDYPDIGYTSYGLLPLYSYKSDRLKEIGNGGNTQLAENNFLKKILNTDVTQNVFDNNQNNQNNFEASKIRPISANNLELDSSYFGVKRLTQELKAFSSVLNKKNIVKKLYKSNKCLSEGKFSQQYNYHFYNYNCMNFFNILPGSKISQEYKSNFINNSHKNALIYSNTDLSSNNFFNNPKIEFNNNNLLTINFWINPKRTSLIGKRYNPGCILHLPNLISIYLISDETKLNANNQPIEFKILCLLGDDSNKLIGNTTITNSLLSTDNLLLNTWNNISVIIREDNISLYINDNKTSLINNSNIITMESLNLRDNFSIFTIGNRLNNEQLIWNDDNINKLKNSFFNLQTFQAQDINKTEINDNYTDVLDTNLVDWNIKIFDIDQEDFDYSLHSQSLNAELYGLMIFNNEIDFEQLKEYSYGKISVFENISLSFYLPCTYISHLIQRKGYITLGSRDDIAYRSFVNPYFAHKVYGHELSIESFLLDVVNLRKPYILGMNGDEYTGSLTSNAFNFGNNIINVELLNSLKSLKLNIINDFFKKHLNPTQIINKIMTNNLVLLDNNFVQKNMQFNNIVYRNNFILPCDNGLCNLDLNSLFKLQKIQNIIGDSLNVFYENKNPYYVKLNTLFESSNQYSFETCLEFFNNNDLNNLISTVYSLPNFTQSFLFDINNQNHIQKTVYNNIPSVSNQLSAFFNRLKAVNNKKHLLSNSILKNIDDKYDPSVNLIENINWTSKEFDSNNVFYSKYFNSHYSIEGELSETHSVLFDISNVLYSSKIRNKNIEILDVDLSGSGGALNIKIKDNGNGLMYRADCNGPHATWAHIGHAFYSDGLVNVLHPGLSNFGENNFSINLKGEHSMYIFQIDIPIEKGELNHSLNPSYIKGLKPSGNLSDLQEDNFVYLTGVNLHDENLNIVARANFAQPIVKRTNDRYNIRLKMDF